MIDYIYVLQIVKYNSTTKDISLQIIRFIGQYLWCNIARSTTLSIQMVVLTIELTEPEVHQTQPEVILVPQDEILRLDVSVDDTESV